MPFQPRGVSVFNSAFETHFPNVLLSGVLAFLVLLELENVTDVLVYRHYSINKRSLDTYMLYSRISSIRSVFRTLGGVEWASNQVATVPKSSVPSHYRRHSGERPSSEAHRLPSTKDCTPRGVPCPQLRYRKLLFPLLIRFTLLALQLFAIYSSSTTTRDVPVTPNFNLVLSNNTKPLPSPKGNFPSCRSWIQSTRGVEQNGDVLLCIDSEESRRFEGQPSQNTTLHFLFSPDENRFEFIVRDHLAMESRVFVKAKISFLSGENVGVAPLRPDLTSDNGTAEELVKKVMVNALRRQRVEIRMDDIRTFTDSNVTYNYSCSLDLCDRVKLSNAVLDELRTLKLDVNKTSTGVWLFNGTGYIFEDKKAIAVVSSNRVAQGWFLIIWVALLLTRLIANRWLSDFEELAYAALKKVHGERMSVGPLAVTEHRAPVFVRKFSDGRVGHIGFRPASPRQRVVESFQDCEVVLGTIRHTRGTKGNSYP
ncbi:hypothetical protein BWQ96_05238 [Gracilariopsis chorda]|uniref:Uncharacterized protein n=1 Tax=Gracilariopsis chorda TaxID=448386 RepID=A0A2V3IS94_9FLOR|nr:hypothetical protein BWQ96_05238 [Gracilariopsis chorda]|eukprot:PXF44991.1 hypothetical protein BWQ96_05238 [Gracilariopsis chorda]